MIRRHFRQISFFLFPFTCDSLPQILNPMGRLFAIISLTRCGFFCFLKYYHYMFAHSCHSCYSHQSSFSPYFWPCLWILCQLFYCENPQRASFFCLHCRRRPIDVTNENSLISMARSIAMASNILWEEPIFWKPVENKSLLGTTSIILANWSS